MEDSKETTLERINQLTNNKDHIHEQALRLAGIYLRSARDEIIELEAAQIDEDDNEINAACSAQLEVIGDEIVRLGTELELQAKETPCSGPGETYLLRSTPNTTHLVYVDGDHASIGQRTAFLLSPDDIEMLTTVLKAIKADKNIPHHFSNVNARYNFFYEPGGAGNTFVVRHIASGRIVGMDTRTAFELLKALTGKTEHLTKLGTYGPTLVPSTRRKVWVKITEENDPPSSLFDQNVAYPSDALPEWFKHLQPTIEDTTFTDMSINLGNKVRYHITLVGDEKAAANPPTTCGDLKRLKIIDEAGSWSCCTYCESDTHEGNNDAKYYITTPKGRKLTFCCRCADSLSVSDSSSQANAWIDEALNKPKPVEFQECE